MIARTIALAIGIIGALIASQLPEFAQQYRQRLGGTIDELQRQVSEFDQDAGASGLTRDQALAQLRSGPDEFVKRRGDSEARTLNRLERMQQHRDALQQAGPFMRVVDLARYGDPQLADRTLSDFEPAVPTTAEGAVIGGAGFVFGYGLIRALTVPFRRRRKPSWMTRRA
jgi:hypothetical protein